MLRLAVLLLLTLSACGADGAPQPPASGVTVSGSGYLGVGKTTAETP